MAKIGTEVAADRCYVFENMRGPDGRLWMDLVGEWTAEAVVPVFKDSRQHLHPYFPDFQAWIDVLGHGVEVVGLVDRMEEPTRSVLRAEGTVSTWLIPVALILPLTYGLDAVRGLLLKTETLLPLPAEIIILIVFMFVMVWFGAWVFNRVERRVRTLGTLGQH